MSFYRRGGQINASGSRRIGSLVSGIIQNIERFQPSWGNAGETKIFWRAHGTAQEETRNSEKRGESRLLEISTAPNIYVNWKGGVEETLPPNSAKRRKVPQS